MVFRAEVPSDAWKLCSMWRTSSGENEPRNGAALRGIKGPQGGCWNSCLPGACTYDSWSQCWQVWAAAGSCSVIDGLVPEGPSQHPRQGQR